MANVTPSILKGALQEVKRQMDKQDTSFDAKIDEVYEELDTKVNVEDVIPMTIEESDDLFDEVYGSWVMSRIY